MSQLSKKLLSQLKFIDLSVPISPDFYELDPVVRQIISHKEGANLLGQEKITYRDFPNEKGLSLMRYTLNTHTGTHMDAPYHYGDCDQHGHPAKSISDVPLKYCYSQGVLIDVSQGKPNTIIQKNEIIESLLKNKCTIQPNNIVLIHANKNQAIGTADYFRHYRGISREALEWIIDQGVNVVGMDSFSFDPPFEGMIQRYLSTKNKAELWPAHFLGREKPYFQLERLTGLDKLIPYRQFTVSCFPIKLLGADAAWCRVVAIINPQRTIINFSMQPKTH